MSVLADLEVLLTTSQVAHILGCHPSACVRWIQKGAELSDRSRLKLQALAIPGGWRVRREWLDDFLQRITADRAGEPVPAPKTSVKTARVQKMRGALAAVGFSRGSTLEGVGS